MDYKIERRNRMYTNIAVPNDLIEKVERIVGSSKLGYRSRSEFIIEAVRDKVRDVSKMQEVIS